MNMTLPESAPPPYRDRRCGPGLMIAMLVLIVVALAAMFLFQQKNRSASQPAVHPLTHAAQVP